MTEMQCPNCKGTGWKDPNVSCFMLTYCERCYGTGKASVPTFQRIYERLDDVDKYSFWVDLYTMFKWRGWDELNKNGHHAREFTKRWEKLLYDKYGVSIEEYT